MADEVCAASTDDTFSFLAECTLSKGHRGRHVDENHDVSWPGMGIVPPREPGNRADRRGNFVHPKPGRGGYSPRARNQQ